MLKETLATLKRDKNVLAVYQFGSHGTKKQTPLSDIDWCVFTKNSDKKKLLHIYSSGTDTLDISLFDHLPAYIKPEVFKGKPLFVKDNKFIQKKFVTSFREFQDFRRVYDKYQQALKKRHS
ncbi:MAG TPA: nucleotidyltransferase domain-containing protein [Candidatus Nanoarchaeia archaeon]|nr:nucleotidyltransferase domain-containing protein [Candidatus Nanoarchaeia archaeon]